jgi:hypothetical protein
MKLLLVPIAIVMPRERRPRSVHFLKAIMGRPFRLVEAHLAVHVLPPVALLVKDNRDKTDARNKRP